MNALDLTKMLFDQISTCSTFFVVPGGPIIMGHLVIVSLLYFLLEPELLKAVEGNVTGV